MSFLKKHYEKIILTAFLLIFIISLVWQIGNLTKSVAISEDDLSVRIPNADYTPMDFKAPRYNIIQVLTSGAFWNPKKTPNEEGATFFTDLLNVPRISRCTHTECSKLIPYSDFENKKCSQCGRALRTGPIVDINKDTDRDKIPDEIEKKVGTNYEVVDSLEDFDGDGFCNLIEYTKDETGSWINDPKKHPPLIERVALAAITRKRLDILLKKVTGTQDTPKNQLRVHIEVKRKTKFLKLMDNIELDGNNYKIIDVSFKTKQVYNKELDSVLDTNVSEIIIKKASDDPIKVIVGQKKVYEPKPKVTLYDFEMRKKFVITQGQQIRLGDSNTGRENYTLKPIENPKGSYVKLVDKDGNEYTVIKKYPKYKIDEKKLKEKLKDVIGINSEEARPYMDEPNNPGMPGLRDRRLGLRHGFN